MSISYKGQNDTSYYAFNDTDSRGNPLGGGIKGEGCEVLFQAGPIKEVGVNGCDVIDILRGLEHRMAFYQGETGEGTYDGKFACAENAAALFHIREAKRILEERTAARRAQGVEGHNLAHAV